MGSSLSDLGTDELQPIGIYYTPSCPHRQAFCTLVKLETDLLMEDAAQRVANQQAGYPSPASGATKILPHLSFATLKRWETACRLFTGLLCQTGLEHLAGTAAARGWANDAL